MSFYLLFYAITVVCVVLNIFVTILIDAYEAAVSPDTTWQNIAADRQKFYERIEKALRASSPEGDSEEENGEEQERAGVSSTRE